MNQAKRNLAGFGTYTAALAAGGETPPVTANVESYDGSSWTEIANLNTARRALAGSGTQTAGIVYGGVPNTAITESWDGTSWTEVADLGTAISTNGGAGTGNTLALSFGGESPITTATEEWTLPEGLKTLASTNA